MYKEYTLMNILHWKYWVFFIVFSVCENIEGFKQNREQNSALSPAGALTPVFSQLLYQLSFPGILFFFSCM